MTLYRARILLVDDDTLHLEVFHEWLSACGAEVAMASEGERALALMRPGAFDVALIDLKMPGIPGLELMDLLKDCDPSLEIIFLSGAATMHDAIAALRQGRAFDFLLKPITDLHQINAVIEQALERRRKHPRTAMATAPLPSPPFFETLTPREQEILAWLAQGDSNMQIAQRLDLSEKTVRNVLTAVYEKLKVTSRAQAIVAYRHFGLDLSHP
jgi:DNA-binding NarL/FixJ family response regulator